VKTTVTSNRKVTKHRNKDFVNIQSRFHTSSEFCNKFGARIGDRIKMKIEDSVFVATVSDFITLPWKTVITSDLEIEKIKSGTLIKKPVELEVLEIFKINRNVDKDSTFTAILAHLFSDGSISPSQAHFTNKETEAIEHFQSLMTRKFPASNIKTWCDDGILHAIVEDVGVLSILTQFVDKFGRKSITNPHVPEFIQKDTELCRTWLKHAFSDEGWVNTASSEVRIGRNVRFRNDDLVNDLPWKFERTLNGGFNITSAKLDKYQLGLIPQNNLLHDESSMLKNLGIKFGMRPRKKVNLIDDSISAQIELSVSAKRFSEIGFCLTRKQKELDRLLN